MTLKNVKFRSEGTKLGQFVEELSCEVFKTDGKILNCIKFAINFCIKNI